MCEVKISGQRVFTGRIVTLEIDQVRLPGGRQTTREVVRHPGAAVMLPVLDDGRIVLVRQYRYPAAETLLELPAGKLEPGEDPLECARRELVEETGWQAARWRGLGSFFTAPGFTDELLHAFMATRLERPSEPYEPDADEISEVVLLSVGETRERIVSGEIRDAKTITTLHLADLRGWLEIGAESG